MTHIPESGIPETVAEVQRLHEAGMPLKQELALPVLLARIAQLEVDAKRLDWLESERSQIFTDDNRINVYFSVALEAWCVSPERLTDASKHGALREAIDAAMNPAPTQPTEPLSVIPDTSEKI